MQRVNNALAWEQQQHKQSEIEKQNTIIAESRKVLSEKMPWVTKPEGATRFKESVNLAMQKVGKTPAQLKRRTRMMR
jgi:hypothetical protein